MYQQLILIGHLGNDVEMRYTPSGVPVANFRIAVSKKFNDASGQTQEKTTWFRVACWRKLAEVAAQYLHKGSKVMVIGEVEDAKPYTDREGNQRASLEVTAQTIKFLDSKGNGGEQTQSAPSTDTDEAPPF